MIILDYPQKVKFATLRLVASGYWLVASGSALVILFSRTAQLLLKDYSGLRAKINSLSLAVPAAQLYPTEIYRAINFSSQSFFPSC